MVSEPVLSSVYVSGGCNQSPHCVDWDQDVICYGSGNAVLIYTTNNYNGRGQISATLRAHTDRVNTVFWLRPGDKCQELVSGSSDSTLIIWSAVGDEFRPTCVCKGHTGPVTVASGLNLSRGRALIVSTSSDSTIKIWKRDEEAVSLAQNLDLNNSLCLALSLSLIENDNALLAVSLDAGNIQLLGVSTITGETSKLLVLKGHTDWVRGFDFTTSDGDLYLASGGQDAAVRLWKMSPEKVETVVTDEFTVDKKIIHFGDKKYSVALESVLFGHEGWVYSVKWSNFGEKLLLMSLSFDRTIALWEIDEESGIWLEKARLGQIGGDTLGYLSCSFGPKGESIVAHSHNGALRIWVKNGEDWETSYVCGGHSDGVMDLCWEPGGKYLLSASIDQTTRLHAPWIDSENVQRSWHEVSRPQIHGYALNAIATLPKFKFISGAEEKVGRVFSAPRNFLENLSCLSGSPLIESETSPMGATVPALGLSNKAVFLSETPNPDDLHIFSHGVINTPPTEDYLSQNTLWPEIMKLYGHGFELYSVAASHDGRYVATSCKATSPQFANIILWSTDTWKQIDTFAGCGHTLTITQMSFSPDDSILLSVSRDRTWCAYQRNEVGEYKLKAFSNKNTRVHSRIIWSCDWSPDGRYFATGSREGTVAIWSSENIRSSESESVADKSWLAGEILSVDGAVTAVAFAPITKQNMYIVAVGCETGEIKFFRFSPDLKSPWKLLYESQKLHSKTVRRLAFRPASEDLYLASASLDNTVQIHKISSNVFNL